MQKLDAALDEGGIDVVLGARITRLKLPLGSEAADAERRIHKHHIEPASCQFDEGDALGRIACKETPAHARGAGRRLSKTAQRLNDASLSLVEEVVVVDTGEIQRALLGHAFQTRKETCPLLLLHKLLTRMVQLGGDAVFHAKQRPQFTGQTTFAHHLLEQVTQQRWIETRCKFVDQHRIARHRLRYHDMCALNTRPIGCGNANVFPCPLRPQP